MSESAKLRKGEQVAYELRTLFDTYGYRRYRMSNFEEYGFYLDNKDFLTSGRQITFNDLDGRLMALKPDVTLSIVKNAKAGDKVYYLESVYRPSVHNVCFKEIEQLGLEAVGEIDIYTECEVALLAAKSLERIDSRYALDISHMGLVAKLCDWLAEKGNSDTLIGFLKSKNYHEAESVFGADGFMKAVFDGDLDRLEGLGIDGVESITRELRTVIGFLKSRGIEVNVDFSLINDVRYYNGIVLRGYVEKVPRPVLSGGRYDGLLTKLNKDFGGIGFAVYLDELDVYDIKAATDCDVLLVYGDADAASVAEAAEKIRAQGKSVRVIKTLDGEIRRAETLKIQDGRVVDYDA